MAKSMIKGREFAHCNCAYGCPCQFNALPTYWHCHALVAMEIDEGFYGRTRLDGLRVVVAMRWPGAIHEGNGEIAPIIDEPRDAAATRRSHANRARRQ
jgi:hypothetical protein